MRWTSFEAHVEVEPMGTLQSKGEARSIEQNILPVERSALEFEVLTLCSINKGVVSSFWELKNLRKQTTPVGGSW